MPMKSRPSPQPAIASTIGNLCSFQHRWTDAYAWFRFTSAERETDPPSFNWQTLRLKPPDPVAIYLGGQLAINGLITSRQTAYEGNNHAVQLEGRGLTWAAATASILDKSSDYNGMTFEQIARRVMAPTGVRHQNHRQSQRADIRARAQ
jgi:hypothetical protein